MGSEEREEKMRTESEKRKEGVCEGIASLVKKKVIYIYKGHLKPMILYCIGLSSHPVVLPQYWACDWSKLIYTAT